MEMLSDATRPPADVRGNVILPIPDINRAKEDLRNVMGVVLERSVDGQYRIGTKEGLVNKVYLRYVQ
jgi:hypothetical protein